MCTWEEQKGENEDTRQHPWQLGVTETGDLTLGVGRRQLPAASARRGVRRVDVLPPALRFLLRCSYCAAAVPREPRSQTIGDGETRRQLGETMEYSCWRAAARLISFLLIRLLSCWLNWNLGLKLRGGRAYNCSNSVHVFN